MQLVTIILAAGKGKRMNSDLPKVLLKANGKSMLEYNLNLAKEIGSSRIITVIGYRKEDILTLLKHWPDVETVVQEEQLGTGHAVMQVSGNLADYKGNILVLYGDVPLLTTKTINQLADFHNQNENAVSVLSAKLDNPFGYGRIVRDEYGEFEKIVEEKDASDEEKMVQEINSGIMVFRSEELFRSLNMVRNNNSQKEYYLTDTIEILRDMGRKVGVIIAENSNEVLGANTPVQLQEIEEVLKNKSKLL